MKIIKLKCPNCGATFSVAQDSQIAVCEYCGTKVAIPKKKAKVTVKRVKVNRRAFVVFGAVAALLIIVTGFVLNTLLNGKSVDPLVYKTAA